MTMDRARPDPKLDRSDAAAGDAANLLRAYRADAEKLLHEDRLQEARATIRQALRLAPKDAAALNILGVIELQSGNLEEAAATIRRAADLQPAAPEPLHYLGLTYKHLGRYADAIASFRAALALRPDMSPSLIELATSLAILGRHDEAKDVLFRMIELTPDDVATYFDLAQFAPKSLAPEHLSRLGKIARDSEEDLARRASAGFTLAAVHEALADYDAEFECLKRANDLLRDHLTQMDGKLPPSGVMPVGARPKLLAPAKALTRVVAMRSFIESTIDGDFIRRYEGAGHPSNLPIFVLGMPRSGSSLIEQILSSHPMVHGAGEIDAFDSKIVKLQWPYDGYLQRDGTGALRATEPPARHFRKSGAEYVKALRGLNSRARRIVDKMPVNYFHIGMIHLCLPNAIVIHSMRDPVDTCLGCYRRLFGTGNETTYDLGMLGRHYVEYRKVMAHWQRVLPGRVIDVAYEELVADPERETRRLLDLCGLPWNDACLRFYENKRPVLTSSLAQVRQPIHQNAVQRWRRYEKHLGPLFEALGPYAPKTGQFDRPD